MTGIDIEKYLLLNLVHENLIQFHSSQMVVNLCTLTWPTAYMQSSGPRICNLYNKYYKYIINQSINTAVVNRDLHIQNSV